MKIFCRLASTLLIGTLCAGQPKDTSAEATSPNFGPLPEGRFGKAYDGRQISVIPSNADDAYRIPPLTVECWAKLESPNGFNIIAACDAKASSTHWEIYSHSGTGTFAAFLPGSEPDTVQSDHVITDNEWHYLAMIYEPERVRLYVDGKLVEDQPVKPRPGGQSLPGPLQVGGMMTDGIGCNGLVDELRISKGARTIGETPGEPFSADEQTVGLWNFDEIKDKAFADASARNQRIQLGASSLNDWDRISFRPGPAPMDSPANEIQLVRGDASLPPGPVVLSLDGEWQMAEGGAEADRMPQPDKPGAVYLYGARTQVPFGKVLEPNEWPDAIPATVPGSVHTALEKAGRIPDPKFGRNDAIARERSTRTWWFKRTFPRPADMMERPRLVFGGVAIKCHVWLNGEKLGEHNGMFGGPFFDLTGKLKDHNTLIVKLDPAPGDPNDWGFEGAWKTTAVFNNSFGWHYSSIPPLGIWRSVRIEGQPTVSVADPLFATRDAIKGDVDLATKLKGPAAGFKGTLTGVIRPANFEGESCHFEYPVSSAQAEQPLNLRFTIPDPRPWWPNGVGEPNLYRVELAFTPDGGGVADRKSFQTGLRTVEMGPLPGGPRPQEYNWTFIINGRPMFVKGTGWCTMDSSMDFSPARYDRLLSLARDQHIQMVRAWGPGMPETDEFYDHCDKYGIMVMQEWPTAWNSHSVQPFDVLEETVRLNTLRLRNRPSLVIWGAGNESFLPFGPAIDMMGRYAVELDGTRPFHRAEPWGGSTHNYDVYWLGQHIDRSLQLVSAFFGEFGMASMPVHESVLRYLPENEKTQWPPLPGGTLLHHTPIFNLADDWKRLSTNAAYFTEAKSLEEFIAGSQLSQVVGVRHTLERARSRWPECTGALLYKLNDNYPAASWATADWYGAPKMAHYFFQDAFAPLHACVVWTETFNMRGKDVLWPVFLLDDADALKDKPWEVTVRAYDANLRQIKSQFYSGNGAIDRVRQVGEFALTATETDTSPLLVVTEVKSAGKLAQRTFSFANFETVKDCLFRLPKTELKVEAKDGALVVSNRGKLPAVAVNVNRPGHADSFSASDNFFWLDPGESHTVTVKDTGGTTVEAWNADPAGVLSLHH